MSDSEDDLFMEVKAAREALENSNSSTLGEEGEEEATDGPKSTSELADELAEISLRTNDEGQVECRIVDVKPYRNDNLALTVALPTRETVTFTLKKPVPWSSDFLFARLVEDFGYGAGDIDRLEDERVYLERAEEPNVEMFSPRDHFRSARRGKVIPPGEESGQRSNGWKLVDPAPEKAPRDGMPFWKEHERLLKGTGGTGVLLMAVHTLAYWTALTVADGLFLALIAGSTALLCYMAYETSQI